MAKNYNNRNYNRNRNGNRNYGGGRSYGGGGNSRGGFSSTEKFAHTLGQVQQGLKNPDSLVTQSFKNGEGSVNRKKKSLF